jgi:NADH:ubiquinone oxidoreductase subunit E
MIARFSEFLNNEGLNDKVELKGCFCMERCGEGINWMFNDEVLSSSSVQEGAEMFREKVLQALKPNGAKPDGQDAGRSGT